MDRLKWAQRVVFVLFFEKKRIIRNLKIRDEYYVYESEGGRAGKFFSKRRPAVEFLSMLLADGERNYILVHFVLVSHRDSTLIFYNHMYNAHHRCTAHIVVKIITNFLHQNNFLPVTLRQFQTIITFLLYYMFTYVYSDKKNALNHRIVFTWLPPPSTAFTIRSNSIFNGSKELFVLTVTKYIISIGWYVWCRRVKHYHMAVFTMQPPHCVNYWREVLKIEIRAWEAFLRIIKGLKEVGELFTKIRP